MGYLGGNNAPIIAGTSGGGGGAMTKINRGVTKERRFNKTSDVTIPAGCFFVDVMNRGLANIMINGDTVYPGDRWNSEERIDYGLLRQEFCPEIEIEINNGAEASIHVCYPQASSVDVSLL